MKKAAAGGLIVTCAVLYTVLAVLAHLHRYFGIDLWITLALQHFRSDPTTVVLAFVSWFGYFPEFVPEFGVILLGFFLLRLRVEAVVMSIAELGVAIQGFVLKPIVGRPRPSASLVWVKHKLTSDPYTYTAGHVHTFVVIFGFIAFLAARRMQAGWRRTAVIGGSVLFLVLTAVSRVYLGDHWSSDVVGGFLAGGTWLGAAILAYLVLLDRGVVHEADRRRTGAARRI